MRDAFFPFLAPPRPPCKVYINDMIVAVEAAKQGGTMGEDTVSGFMFVNDFVGISETPEGLQKQVEKALGYTINNRKRRVTPNVKKCAVVVCNEGKMNPVNGIANGSGEKINYRS